MPQGFVSPVSGIANVIQLAVAPVFLLSAVGAFLGVLTSRLGLIIERARWLEERLAAATPGESDALHDSLAMLSHRAKLLTSAITLCTACALLICCVVIVLFLSAFVPLTLNKISAFLFIAGLVALFAGLLFFLREIFLGIRVLSIGRHPSDSGR